MEHLYKSIVCMHCGDLIRVPVYCKDRFCVICSPGRRSRIQQKIKYLLRCAVYPPGYFLGMITVSLVNPPHLGEGIKKLQKSFAKLRSTKMWKSKIRGGVYVIEITGGPGGWHPHIHALVEQKFISWQSFQSRWLAISGGSAFHVKKVPAGQAERYITKYLSKPAVEPEALELAQDELRHVRLFQPFGLWHGLLRAFVRPQYPCPNCGQSVWMPMDAFFYKNLPGSVPERSPPGAIISSVQSESSSSSVVQGALFDEDLEAAGRNRCRVYEEEWPGQ